jgi:hypothetical protein
MELTDADVADDRTHRKISDLRVAFTCASAKDRDKVTVRLSELKWCWSSISPLNRGDEIVIDVLCPHSIHPVHLVFTVNRDFTAATNAWPRRLPVPTVGCPVLVKVVNAGRMRRA